MICTQDTCECHPQRFGMMAFLKDLKAPGKISKLQQIECSKISPRVQVLLEGTFNEHIMSID